ncbi:MAG: hypothetical protein NVSMB48_21540 [Marmoricola sp.]
MSRLPSALQPAWPYFKMLHRFLTLLFGYVFRAVSPLLGPRGVPTAATSMSMQTAQAEPGVVTVHPGGPAQRIERRAAVGEPPRHWVFAGAQSAEIPARYVLDVEGGLLTGPHGATVTPGKRLDYQTSGYFGISGWREHPLFLHPTLGRIENVAGTALSLTTRGTATNYYHFLYDAIGRYGIFREALPDQPIDVVIVPHETGYQRQLLDLIGIAAPLLQPREHLTYRAERLLVPSTPNQDLDAPPWVTQWLREALPPRPTGPTPPRLYLSRGQQPNTRRYVQEPELWPELERRGFVMLDPGALSVQEQINTFHGAEIVVAPHGAGLTNLTFCRPGTRVLELFAPNYVHLGLWTICESVGGIDYRYLIGDGPSRAGRPMVGVLEDVSIPTRRVLATIDAMLD